MCKNPGKVTFLSQGQGSCETMKWGQKMALHSSQMKTVQGCDHLGEKIIELEQHHVFHAVDTQRILNDEASYIFQCLHYHFLWNNPQDFPKVVGFGSLLRT